MGAGTGAALAAGTHIELLLPVPDDRRAVLACRATFIGRGDSLDDVAAPVGHPDYDRWYRWVRVAVAAGKRGPPSQRWPTTLLDRRRSGGQLVGVTDICRRLNSCLQQFGGRIGYRYSIHPQWRRQDGDDE